MESITRVGIDVSKDWLDVLIDRPRSKQLRFCKDAEGITELTFALGRGNYVIALEATGRYESLVRHGLEATGYTVRVKNPRQMRRLAQGLGVQAKTDGIDAKLLAQTAQLGSKTSPRSKEREALGDLSRTIECLKKERARHKKRVQVPGFSACAASSLLAVVKAIDAEVKKLEKAFVALVRKSSLAGRYDLALSVCGVGPHLARIAVCELPENLQDWSVRQLWEQRASGASPPPRQRPPQRWVLYALCRSRGDAAVGSGALQATENQGPHPPASDRRRHAQASDPPDSGPQTRLALAGRATESLTKNYTIWN